MAVTVNAVDQAVQRVIDGAPVDWQAIADECDRSQLETVCRELESMAQYLARAAGYFHARDLGQSHKQAVRRSNDTIAAIRRSLGFTYPRNDVHF